MRKVIDSVAIFLFIVWFLLCRFVFDYTETTMGYILLDLLIGSILIGIPLVNWLEEPRKFTDIDDEYRRRKNV